jgi:hypothetical protein
MLDEARQAFQEHNASNQSVNQDTLTCASVYGTAQGRREGHPPTALASHVQPGQALGSSEVTRVSYAVVD